MHRNHPPMTRIGVWSLAWGTVCLCAVLLLVRRMSPSRDIGRMYPLGDMADGLPVTPDLDVPYKLEPA